MTGLETTPLYDLLQFDKTYLERIKLRREIMAAHPEETLACKPEAEPAVKELYGWLFGVYLPGRYPPCFEIVHSGEDEEGGAGLKESEKGGKCDLPTHLLNKITLEKIPLLPPSPSPFDPIQALLTISSHIDTDFLILLPQPPTNPPSNPPEPPNQTPQASQAPPQEQATYHLLSFATTFPSGFRTLSKLSQPLSSIHAPVPGYRAKLEKSMDRFFSRLEKGKMVRRANWTVTGTPDLFAQGGTHFHSNPHSHEEEEEKLQAEIEEARRKLNVADMRVRCELQTLHRLQGTGALVFAFKTYQYTLQEIKDEGEGSAGALAEATKGFARGSVPEMEHYKRAVVWGEVVRGFLREGGKKDEVEGECER